MVIANWPAHTLLHLLPVFGLSPLRRKSSRAGFSIDFRFRPSFLFSLPSVLLSSGTASPSMLIVKMRAGWSFALLCFATSVSSVSSSQAVRTTAPVVGRQVTLPPPTVAPTSTALRSVQGQDDQGYATCGYYDADPSKYRASSLDDLASS